MILRVLTSPVSGLHVSRAGGPDMSFRWIQQGGPAPQRPAFELDLQNVVVSLNISPSFGLLSDVLLSTAGGSSLWKCKPIYPHAFLHPVKDLTATV
jgi:hypothetical protein